LTTIWDIDHATAVGRERARQDQDARVQRRASRAAHTSGVDAFGGAPPLAGYLLAEGDSWFNYPFHDVLAELEDEFNYDVRSGARWGDTAEHMAYGGGGSGRNLVRQFEKLARAGHTPRAILLSCGGNDVAGENFAALLNPRASQHPGLNEDAVRAIVDGRLRAAIITLIAWLKELGRGHFEGQDVPVVLHGYGHPVPDGRGVLGGAWILPGPWLAPGFLAKGYDDLAERRDLAAALIDRFNAMLQGVVSAGHWGSLRYVDVRATLSNELTGQRYKQSWSNELHPTARGFAAVAARFHEVLQTL
jgi:hypothetical protein